MKVTKSYIKQLVKEELNKVLEEEMAPYGIDPYKLPQQGTVGEYSWRARIMKGSNTASEKHLDLEVTDKDGKTVVQEIPRIFAHAVATMLGKLSNEPEAAKRIIDNVLRQGKEKASPVRGSHEKFGMSSDSGGSSSQDSYWNR